MPPKGFPRHVDPVAARHQQPSESDEEDEEGEVDLTEIMNEMALGERRRVYALKGLFNDFKALRRQLHEEIAKLQIANQAAVKRLYDIRRDIVQGARDISAEEAAGIAERMAAAPESEKKDDSASGGDEGKKAVKIVTPGEESNKGGLAAAAASPTGGIPDFWLTSLMGHVVFSNWISERDKVALQHLKDIQSEFVEGHPHKGVRLTFSFAPNEFFTDEALTKTYLMEFDEDDGDVEITKVEGSEIHWTSPKNNLTVTLKEKKMRNKRTKQICVVEREEKCESFFNFFSPPAEPEEDADDDDEDADFYEQDMEEDIEAGQALMEEVVPRAAFYYTGKAMEEMRKELMEQFGNLNTDDDEEEEEEEEEDGAVDFQAMVNRRGGGGGAIGGRGAGRGAGGPPQQQECKQQ